jgi:pilus assembly protein CpaB
MKPARIIVICVAAVAAIGLALRRARHGIARQKPTAVATAAAPCRRRPMAKVLVAAKDLQPGKRLAEGDLDWKDWPVDEVNPAFITDGSVPPSFAARPGRRRNPGSRRQSPQAPSPR